MGLGLIAGFSCSFTLWLMLILFSSFTYSSPVFFESFDKSWEGRWIPSEKKDYQGKWKHEKNDAYDDYGLLVSQTARKYGIAVKIPEVHFKDDPVVLQYDLKAQNGLVCGGAYLKYLIPQNAGWDPKHFDNQSPFSIMFGPDKCGATNKVCFIFRHKNPKTDKYVEHHLKYSPLPITDKITHVYTAVIYPNSTLKILIDGEEKKTANLLSGDFDPPVLPPMTIPDPDDKKPEDWDERAKIPDPKLKKPDNWDEDAPMEIEDLDAKKPEGWLEDEPKEIDDPDSQKPADWDDDKDGNWKIPKITNPKCEEAPGCGKWERPLKRNPNYKGKWYPPMIDNPNYKGFWKPQNIPNPAYFGLKCPNMEAITAIGIEIWTMQDGLLFDNILIANNVSIAQEYRDKYWKPKFEADKEKQKGEEDVEPNIPGMLTEFKGKVFDFLYKIAAIPLVAPYKAKIIKVIFGRKKIPSASLEGKKKMPQKSPAILRRNKKDHLP
ncbi:calnexin homolog isoform X2 [Cryptomeria japonica]|uniref:calnexin homolog isoform X2 n=1 Tax=Cryptomeria japonica TaxID=3369 RepID=UPI0027DA294C|nr:calnexin homolog isoform X2 [Cryptomeria japonica]